MQLVDLSGAPKVDRLTAVRFWLNYLYRHYVHGTKHGHYGPPSSQRTLKNIEEKILKEARKGGDIRERDVPRIRVRDLDAETFQKIYLTSNTPVIIDGLADNWEAVQEWSPDYFAEQFGEQTIPVRVKGDELSDDALKIEDMPLRRLTDNIHDGGNFFGANLADIFNNNPSLREMLDLNVLTDYMVSNPKSKIGSTQLFLSGSGTRSGFHCTGGINLFVQVYGEKEWTFVSPKHSIFMSPMTRRDMFYAATPFDWKKPYDEIEASGYPLYRYIPKFRANLKQGDVLFSPQWWWHAVDTPTPAIGVAVRAMNEFMLGNLVFATIWTSSKEFRQLVFEIMKHGWGTDAKSGARLAFEQSFVDRTTA